MWCVKHGWHLDIISHVNLDILPLIFSFNCRFLLSTHYTRYDHHPALFSLNLISLVALALIPKLPQLHRQRLSFGSGESFSNGDLSTGANTRRFIFEFGMPLLASRWRRLRKTKLYWLLLFHLLFLIYLLAFLNTFEIIAVEISMQRAHLPSLPE